MDYESVIKKFQLKVLKIPPVLIYTMGKVGSTTVYSSLRKPLLFKRPLFQIHFLNEETLTNLRNEYITKQLPVPEHINTGFLLREHMINSGFKNWKLIILVRHYMPRKISDYFQNLKRFSMDSKELLDHQQFPDKAKILDAIQKDILAFDENNDYVCNWFDDQVKKIFGINVYEYPFDKDKGYTVIRQKGIQILLSRLEDLDENYAEAFGELFNPGFKLNLINSNISKNKEFSEIISEIKGQLNIPEETIHKIYASKHFRHFYPDYLSSEK